MEAIPVEDTAKERGYQHFIFSDSRAGNLSFAVSSIGMASIQAWMQLIEFQLHQRESEKMKCW